MKQVDGILAGTLYLSRYNNMAKRTDTNHNIIINVSDPPAQGLWPKRKILLFP